MVLFRADFGELAVLVIIFGSDAHDSCAKISTSMDIRQTWQVNYKLTLNIGTYFKIKCFKVGPTPSTVIPVRQDQQEWPMNTPSYDTQEVLR